MHRLGADGMHVLALELLAEDRLATPESVLELDMQPAVHRGERRTVPMKAPAPTTAAPPPAAAPALALPRLPLDEIGVADLQGEGR